MEYSVPVYWEEDYVRSLLAADGKRKVKEAYGVFPGYTANAMTAGPMKRDTLRKVRSCIRLLRQQGVRFNCLLDALCMDNLEFTRAGQRRIVNVLNSLVEAGAGGVTVANPYLAMLIKKRYPALSIIVSPAANINTSRRADFWEALGVDVIILPGPVWNHDLASIGIIRKAVKCGIRLAANNGCIRDCPVFLSHQLFAAHSRGQKAGPLDHYRGACAARRLRKPELFIRSDWIRPEDAGAYEDIGVNSFQLADVGLSSGRILKIIDAYLAGSYSGNLLDLLRNCPQAGVYIENKKLSSFLRDMPGDCAERSCDSCAYCKDAAEKSVTINNKCV
jgi:collagenase-like PrtC family protease